MQKTVFKKLGGEMKKAILLFGLIIIMCCASNVYKRYPYPDNSRGTERLIIKLTEAVEKVNVKIDGALVVEDKYTERVEIQAVPVGERDVEIAASGSYRMSSIAVSKTITIKANQDEVILISTPPHSTGYWVLIAVMWFVAFSPTVFIF